MHAKLIPSLPKKPKAGSDIGTQNEDQDDDEELPVARMKEEVSESSVVQADEAIVDHEVKAEYADGIGGEHEAESKVRVRSEDLES